MADVSIYVALISATAGVGPVLGGLLVQLIGRPFEAVLVLAAIVASLVIFSGLMPSSRGAVNDQNEGERYLVGSRG